MKAATQAAQIIKEEQGLIRVVTDYDTDGVCAGAIMFRTLEWMRKNYELNFVKHLDTKAIAEVAAKKPEAALHIFLDFGSGYLSKLKEHLGGSKLIIVDHHQKENALEWPGLFHLNPFLYGVDGKDEVSGASLTYLVARALTFRAHELIDIAIVGCTGDVQQINGLYKGVNKLLLQDALANGMIKHEKGLRLFGRYTRPIHKALEYWDEPIIPDVSGSESGAVQFLSSLGIRLKDAKGAWRTLADLSPFEEQKLATALVLEGLAAGRDYSALVGDVYQLKRNGYEVREFATLLNACGRIEKPLEGVKLALGEISSTNSITAEYKRKIANYLDWLKKNRSAFRKTENATFILAQDVIEENFIGTVLGMIVKSMIGTPAAVGFAKTSEGNIKVSARARTMGQDINLGLALKQAAEAVGGEGGGHVGAAGAKIPAGSAEKFIQALDEALSLQRGESLNKLSAS